MQSIINPMAQLPMVLGILNGEFQKKILAQSFCPYTPEKQKQKDLINAQ